MKNTTNLTDKKLEKVIGGSNSCGGIFCVHCGVKKGQETSASCAKSPFRFHVWQYKPDFEPVENRI